MDGMKKVLPRVMAARVPAETRQEASVQTQSSSSLLPPLRGIPAQMNGRIPMGGQGGAMNMNSRALFEGSRGAGAQVQQVKMRSTIPIREEARPIALGRPSMDQTAPPIEEAARIISRETPPAGMTRKEAGDLASSLSQAINDAGLALAEGEQCIGVDDAVLSDAANVRDRLSAFSVSGDPDARLEVTEDTLALISIVLECSTIYQNTQSSRRSAQVAFAVGGLVVGTIVLLVATS